MELKSFLIQKSFNEPQGLKYVILCIHINDRGICKSPVLPSVNSIDILQVDVGNNYRFLCINNIIITKIVFFFILRNYHSCTINYSHFLSYKLKQR